MKVFYFLFLLLPLTSFSQVSDIRVNPNPFSKRAVVHYTVSAADTITIDVYSQWGQFILALRSNEVINAGIYQDSLRMDTCADGKYLVRIANLRKNLKSAVFLKLLSTSINDPAVEVPVLLYPNPANDKLFIKNISDGSGTGLKIINLTGQVIYTKSTLDTDECIDLKTFSPGIYYLLIAGRSTNRVFKIVKE